MRRPVRYIAGLLLATAAGLAFAAPASAAVAGDPFGDEFFVDQSSEDTYSQFAILNLLSPNGHDNTGLNLPIIGN
ncbi:hypothetical protein OWR29_16165 [Actinoplanes sp. Pm04-4]|uniref:DUF4331 domain-containing protein n=1 Tax=Paractinoplanes pyxinae TaxID=2997416 RepID=A0ABT4AZ74_9ACTN|nr:hypothetical protein [Actinoplanes pyxinae]MCY1139534.1 hypothetical protein [Actinoplanes pyxinae]